MPTPLADKLRRPSSWLLLAAAASASRWFAPPTLGQVTFLNSWGSDLLNMPAGVAVDANGNVYVADSGNNRIVSFTSTGSFQNAFGSSTTSGGQLNGPEAVAVAPSGNLYVANTLNNSIDIFTSSGKFVSTFGTSGLTNGQFDTPMGISAAQNGNIYVADSFNSRVEVFNSTGAFQNTFGSFGMSNGQFQYASALAVGPGGNVYVADTSNNRVQVFDSAGDFLSTFATAGMSLGQLENPYGIAVGPNGSLYVADTFDNRVEEFSSNGNFLNTFGSAGTGDGQFNSVFGVALTPTGIIYVTDQSNNRVQRFFDPTSWVSGTNVFTNPASGPINVTVGLGPGQLMGPSLTMSSGLALVAGALTVNSGGVVTQSGGSISTTGGMSVTAGGSFVYQGGSLNADTISVAGLFQATHGGQLVAPDGLAFTNGGEMLLDGGVTVSCGTLAMPGGLMVLGNALLSAGGSPSDLPIRIYSGAELQLANANLSIISATELQNQGGLIDGSGRINAQVLNYPGAELSVAASQAIAITGESNTNDGLISITGGTLHFTQDLTNESDGTLGVYGALRTDGGLTNNGAFSAGGDQPASLFGPLTNNGLLNLSGAVSVFGIVTNSPGATLHLSGTAPNVFVAAVANAGSLIVDAGTTAVLSAGSSGSGAINNAGSLSFLAPSVAGPIAGPGALTIGAAGAPASLQFAPLARISTQCSLILASRSTLDLTNNALLISYASPAADPVATILPLLRSGYNAGAWTGTGINSSIAAATPGKFALAYVDGNVDSTTAAGPNQFLIEFTLAGDANLDGSVGFADLVAVAQNFGFAGRDWQHGNFTYDPNGSVGFADLVLVAQEFGQTTAIASALPAPLSVSPVWEAGRATTQIPEPNALALALTATGFVLARRRRQP